jgi:hypothetical protein
MEMPAQTIGRREHPLGTLKGSGIFRQQGFHRTTDMFPNLSGSMSLEPCL